ncbi:MAG: EamA domain-containing protein [Burkholderia sp.]|jgi:S-adenosylmethionine uptake transporter
MRQSFWILASTFFTVLTYVFVKKAPQGLWFGDIFFVRSLFLFACLLAVMLASRTAVATKHGAWHLLRGTAGVSALLINIVSVQHLPIATAQTLSYCAPLFIGAFVLVRNRLKKIRTNFALLLTIAAGFAGIVLTLRPSFGAANAGFALLALVSAACSAVSSLTLKKLGRLGEPVPRTAFLFGCSCLAASAVLKVCGGGTPLTDLLQIPELLAVGICTACAQLAQTQAWGRGRTLLCANLQFSAIVFSVLFGVFVFGEIPDSAAAAGIALILATEIAATVLQASRNGHPDKQA